MHFQYKQGTHIFPKFKIPLLLISQLCDVGYKEIFAGKKVQIIEDKEAHLEGIKDKSTNIYTIDLDKASKNQKVEKCMRLMSNIYTIWTKKHLIQHYHKCLCSSTIDTWCKAMHLENDLAYN